MKIAVDGCDVAWQRLGESVRTNGSEGDKMNEDGCTCHVSGADPDIVSRDTLEALHDLIRSIAVQADTVTLRQIARMIAGLHKKSKYVFRVEGLQRRRAGHTVTCTSVIYILGRDRL